RDCLRRLSPSDQLNGAGDPPARREECADRAGRSFRDGWLSADRFRRRRRVPPKRTEQTGRAAEGDRRAEAGHCPRRLVDTRNQRRFGDARRVYAVAVTFDLILVGFGNVARRFVSLLGEQRAALRRDYGITTRIVGIATRRHGSIYAPGGVNVRNFS